MALRFKLLDVPIAIGIDFIVIMLVLGALWRTPEELPAWMAVVTGSVLLHELGHAAVFDYFGVKPSIVLHGGGGLTFRKLTVAPGSSPDPGRRVTVIPTGRCPVARTGASWWTSRGSVRVTYGPPSRWFERQAPRVSQ